MRKCIILLLMFCACNQHHNTASQIYLSGKIGAISNWTLSNYDSSKDRDTLRYKYDTALYLLRGHFSPNNKDKIQATMFYYQNKPEGKSYFYNEDGSLSGEGNYRGGKQNGDFIVYGENKKVKSVIVFKDGIAVSVTHYDEQGNIENGTDISR